MSDPRPSELRKAAKEARKAERGPRYYSRVNRTLKGPRHKGAVEAGATNTATLLAPVIAPAKDRIARERKSRAERAASREMERVA